MPSPHAERYLKVLTSKGFEPTVDDEGDIGFKVDDRRMYLFTSEKETDYIYITFPVGYITPQQVVGARLACNRATAKTKVAKAYVDRDGDYVIITAELFIFDPGHFTLALERALKSINSAHKTYVQILAGYEAVE